MSQTETASPSRDLVPYTPPAAKTPREILGVLIGSSAFKAACIGVALVAGWAAGSASYQGDRSHMADESSRRIELLGVEIAGLRDNLSGELNERRQSVAAMRAGVEELQRTTTASLIRLSGALDRAETDRAAEFSKLVERMARLEKQITDQTPVGSVPKAQLPAPQTRPSTVGLTTESETSRMPMSPPATAPKPEATIRGFVLKGVADGVGLVQTRNGMREVAPGDRLAGAGQVRSIERRGRKWVIVTTEGVIDSDFN